MNEHIRKCCDGAGLDSNWKPGFDSIYGQQLEKFAELIVKECGVALSPMLRDMISRGQAYDIIKEHFGVES
jgi:hypothetical protein